MSKIYGPRRKVKYICQDDYPEELSQYVQLYDHLINLTEETLPECIEFIKKFLKENPKEQCTFIYIISKLWISRPKKLKSYIDLLTAVKSEFHSLNKIPLSFDLRNQVNSLVKDQFSATLSKYFPIILNNKGLNYFTPIIPRGKVNIEDLYTIFPKNTVGYFIINDMINELQEYMSQPNCSFDLRLDIYHVDMITPLELAARFGSVNCFKFLLLNDQQFGSGGLYDAIIGGNNEIIHSCEKIGKECDDPFETAVLYNQNEVADWLLDKENCKIVTPASMLECGNIKALIFGVLNKARFDLSYDHLGLLARLADLGSLILEEFCLKNGADPSKQSKSRKNPLSYAAINGDVDMCKLLIKYDSPINLNKRSPLHDAAECNNVGVCQVLIENGADVNKEAAKKWTPLHFAAWEGSLDACKVLVEHNAALNPMAYKEDYNMFEEKLADHTPLMFAVLNKHRAVAEFLAESGAIIDEKSRKFLKIKKPRSKNGKSKAAAALAARMHDYDKVKDLSFANDPKKFQIYMDIKAQQTALAQATSAFSQAIQSAPQTANLSPVPKKRGRPPKNRALQAAPPMISLAEAETAIKKDNQNSAPKIDPAPPDPYESKSDMMKDIASMSTRSRSPRKPKEPFYEKGDYIVINDDSSSD